MTDSTIFTYRKNKGISQQKLANTLNIPRSTMSFYETKRMYPTLEMAEQMAEILGVTIGKLYNQTELAVILENK